MIRTEFGRTAAKIFGHRTDFGHTFPESGTTNTYIIALPLDVREFLNAKRYDPDVI